MKEIQDIKNDIMLLKNLGNIPKEVELVLLRKLTSLEKQLTIGGVSQQRELLAFRKWQKDNWKDVYLYSDEFMISEFKKANCG